MPTVPRFNLNIQPAALPNVRVRADADLAAFGGGPEASQVNQAVQQQAGIVNRFFQDELNKANDLAVTEKYTEALRRKNDMIYNQKDGLMTKRGKDVIDGDIIGEFEGRMNSLEEDLTSNLTNSEQKRMFQRMMVREKAHLNGVLNKHVFEETKQYANQVTNAFVANSIEDSAKNYHDPERVSDNINLSVAKLKTHAVQYDIPEEVLKGQIENTISKNHVGVLQAMISDGRDLMAKDYLDKNRSAMTSGDFNRVSGVLESASLRGESQRRAISILSQTDDLTEARDMVDRISDTEVRDATWARIKQRVSEDKFAEQQEHQESFIGDVNLVEQTKNIDSIPDVRWSTYSPQERKTLEAMASGAPISTKWQVYTDLRNMALREPTKFMNLNIGIHRKDLADAEFKAMFNLQSNMKSDMDAARKDLDGFRTDTQIASQKLKEIGVNPNATKGADAETVWRFNDALETQYRVFFDNNGRAPNNQEKQKIADALTTEVVIERGVISDSERRVFEIRPGQPIDIDYGDIPKDERLLIEDALRQLSIPVTKERVEEEFLKQLVEDLGNAAQ